MTQTQTDDTRQESDSGEAGEHETEIIASSARSVAEWTTLAISLAIIIAFLGLITWLQMTSNGKPAIVAVEPQIDNLRHDDTGYYLPVTVRNDGAETIADLRIQASLKTPSGETENREFSIDFLVRDEVTSGTMVFTQDPTRGDLTVTAGSYRLP